MISLLLPPQQLLNNPSLCFGTDLHCTVLCLLSYLITCSNRDREGSSSTNRSLAVSRDFQPHWIRNARTDRLHDTLLNMPLATGGECGSNVNHTSVCSSAHDEVRCHSDSKLTNYDCATYWSVLRGFIASGQAFQWADGSAILYHEVVGSDPQKYSEYSN